MSLPLIKAAILQQIYPMTPNNLIQKPMFDITYPACQELFSYDVENSYQT